MLRFLYFDIVAFISFIASYRPKLAKIHSKIKIRAKKLAKIHSKIKIRAKKIAKIHSKIKIRAKKKWADQS
jgi:hypothetical protein